VQREDARRLGADPRRTSGHDRDLADQSFAGCMVVSLVRPKSCPFGGGSAFLENGYGIERDRALAFRAFQANQRPAASGPAHKFIA
jgi:hypothetical protein